MKTNSVDSAWLEEQILQLLSIAKYRNDLLCELQKAILSRNTEDIIKYASLISGVSTHEKQDNDHDKGVGISKGVNPRPKQ